MPNPVTLPDKTKTMIFLVALAVVVALLGGSSNPRVPQLIGLRPLAALFLIPVVYYWQGAKSGPERTLIYLLLGTIVWTLLQIVPLPQSLWSQLPDRELIVELDGALGVGSHWRPISWVPSRGLNALAAMIVPAAALLLAMTLKARNETLLQILLGIALANSLLSIIQVVAGNPDGLYLYDPRSSGSDGLFGNENHAGVFSAMGLLIAARLAAQTGARAQTWKQIAYGTAALVIFLAVLIGGSRAGLSGGVGAAAGAMVMIFLSSRSSRSGASPKTALTSRKGMAGVATVLLIGIAALFFWLDRSRSFDGILTQSALEDLRWELNPVVWEMASKNWLLGIGFGAFEEYYHIYEPTSLLLPQHINLAHNDWAQLILEGGVVGVALLAMLLVWVGKQLVGLIARDIGSFHLFVFWVCAFGLIGAASLVDYPMRTPIFQFAVAWLLLCLARDGQGADTGLSPRKGKR